MKKIVFKCDGIYTIILQRIGGQMRKKWKTLSASQAQFIEYVNKNLDNSNRIIFFKHIGHLGLDYAILSRFKKSEILSFEQLKTKTGKNAFFRLVNIITAIITCIIHENKGPDLRTTISSVLSNMENIYLGVDKNKEYLKYLKIKKLSHKAGKILYFIRIEEKDIETEEDIRCLKLLCKFIKSGKINNTVLLISGEVINLFPLADQENIPIFQLKSTDLDIIAKQNGLYLTESIAKNIELIQKFGLHFFMENADFFDALEDIHSDEVNWIDKVDWIINQISLRKKIACEPLYSLLEFSSFFDNQFSKLEIQNFESNKLNANNLDTAAKLALISRNKSSIYTVPTYFFGIEAFKSYFAIKYIDDLEPMPILIYTYFRENFPFKYLSALKVLSIDSSFIDNKEKQSLVVLGYYFQNYEIGLCNIKDFIRLTTKDSSSSYIMNLFELFKHSKVDNTILEKISYVLEKLENNSLDELATCAGYVILLQLLKERYTEFPEINYSEILNCFRAAVIQINDENNYNKYWQLHFKCQYIALSLEDENTRAQTAKKFLKDVKKVREEENFSAYISANKLRGFTKIDLLSYSLEFDNASAILRNLFCNSEDSTVIKELARINYSAYLIEYMKYNEAQRILMDAQSSFIENINLDTYCGYRNNLIIAQFYTGSLNTDECITHYQELLCKNINSNDKLIILNNLAVIYLSSQIHAELGIEQLKENLNKGNSYNRFLAIHNLLAYYFEKDDKTNFEEIYKRISIPKLFLSDTTFFLNKFKWMKENIGGKEYNNFNASPLVPPCYNELYLYSSIERWFE